jgi:DNA polymerase-1
VSTPGKPRGGPGSLFLFDAYNFLFRAYHALPMLNAPDGRPVNAVHGFVRMVAAARREFQPEMLVAVFDAGGDGGRRAIAPAYKANRPPPPEDLRPQFGLVREAVDAMNLVRIEDPKFEADDVIAAYAVKASAEGHHVTIVSSDKDLMQLVTLGDDTHGSILLYDTMKQKVLGPDEVREKFGVGPELLGDLLALTGDTSDNVPGVPGIGVKTAAALLAEHGSLEGVLAAAPKIKQAKRRERLIESADDARLSRRLVQLNSDIPLPLPCSELKDHGADEAKLVAFFEPLGFKMVLREVAVGQAARRPAGAPSTAAAPPVAAPEGSDAGAIELHPVPGYAPPASTRVLLADCAAELSAYAAALAGATRIAVHLVTTGGDPLSAGIVGLGLHAPGLPAPHDVPTYVPLGHQGDLVSGPQLATQGALDVLAPVLAAKAPTKVAHDHKAQALVLERHGVALGGVDLDPMLASYALDPARSGHDLWSLCTDVLQHALPTVESVLGKGRKSIPLPALGATEAGAWIGQLVHATYALGEALAAQVQAAGKAAQSLYRDIELPLATVLLHLERRGIRVRAEVLREQSRELSGRIAELQAQVDTEAGHPVNLDSPTQLRDLLFEERGLPTGRKTKTGFSTDAKVLEELSVLDPIVGLILDYRQLVKLKNTYLDTLPTLVDPKTGRLHTTFAQAVAATGRISSTDPNIQNIPVRTAEGRRIREAFVASDGKLLVSVDYSQIELRILAHLSGDQSLRSAFVEEVDVHRRTAAEVFEVPEADVTPEQRNIAKAVNFGVVYGQSAFGLAQALNIPRGKAGSYIRAYFEKIPRVKEYMEELIALAARRGYAETILGRKRRIPELARKGPQRGYGERIARNTPIQGSAADILKVAMIAVERELDGKAWAQMLLTVHDELIFECDEGREPELVALVKPLMEDAVKLDVPIRAEAGWGATWAACKG